MLEIYGWKYGDIPVLPYELPSEFLSQPQVNIISRFDYQVMKGFDFTQHIT